MAGLEAKLGSLISNVQHMTDSLDDLKRGVGVDHDKLIGLESAWMSEKKTIFLKLEDLQDAVERESANVRKMSDDLREEFKDGVKTKSDRLFQVFMAIVGIIASVIGAWLVVKLSLSAGG